MHIYLNSLSALADIGVMAPGYIREFQMNVLILYPVLHVGIYMDI
ncbi:hypothetical protein [Kosmotoga pacifica]|nr:hypothetical protein [Kosmotoga pacifica]